MAAEAKAPVRQQEARDVMAARDLVDKIVGGKDLTPQDWEVVAKKEAYINDALEKLMSAKVGGTWTKEFLNARTTAERAAVYEAMQKWMKGAGK